MPYQKEEALKYRRAVANAVLSKDSGGKFARKNIRLREYAEYFYIATGCIPIDDLSTSVMMTTLKKIKSLSDKNIEYQILKLVVDALNAFKNGTQVNFFGCQLYCVCGRFKTYVLNQSTWRYVCSNCGLEGRADNVGLPCSLPANSDVRHLRNLAHRKIDAILGHENCQLTFDELYQLVAYKTHTPLPYMHLGWMTTLGEINAVIVALDELSCE